MLKKLILFCCLLIIGTSMRANISYDARIEFINQYADLAIQEMHRSGIPASITLAQLIIESSWGTGELARNSNNYFGIKCKTEWLGGQYYYEDDDYDANGNLEKSCFRTYNSAYESFIDHTEFLVNNYRYKDCFTYPTNDYVGWAHGLKNGGYATDKAYAQKLIDLINEYQLHQYDRQLYPATSTTPRTSIIPAEPVIINPDTTKMIAPETSPSRSNNSVGNEVIVAKENTVSTPRIKPIPDPAASNPLQERRASFVRQRLLKH